MKTPLLTIVLMAVVIFTGCQESEVSPKLLDQCITLDTTKAGGQWKEAFGDNIETRQAFNLMLLNDAYSKFGKRLTALENPDPNIADQAKAEFDDLRLRIEGLEDRGIQVKGNAKVIIEGIVDTRLDALEEIFKAITITEDSIRIGQMTYYLKKNQEDSRAKAPLIIPPLRPENCWQCTSLPDTGCTVHDKKPNPKPYIYDDPIEREPRNPNEVYLYIDHQDDTICTKHGRLAYGNTYTFSEEGMLVSEKIYCGSCAREVLMKYLDKHIGTDPNE